MERFACIYVRQSSGWKDVFDDKIMHKET